MILYYIGIDIGGTKCTVCLGSMEENSLKILHQCPSRHTPSYTPEEMIGQFSHDIHTCIQISGKSSSDIRGIGISCGGPLNSREGMILSPPNLPGWNNIPICSIISKETGIPSWLCNDANASALAEWRLGAGVGCRDLIFLTFSTGLGAGIIMNNRLISGTGGMAGEVGHIRLHAFGPVGYGKSGSFEGFCSGGGITQLAKTKIIEYIQQGRGSQINPALREIELITSETIGTAADEGDPTALEILQETGKQLGKGLSILIDILNPEMIILGTIFQKCEKHLRPWMEQVILEETLPISRELCKIVPAKLGSSLGNQSALCTAHYYCEQEEL